MQRAKALRDGQAPWTTQTGLVVRGYVSKIDGSVQPYGLVVPAGYQAGAAAKHRLDVWCHGRGETLSEVNFLQDRHDSPGAVHPGRTPSSSTPTAGTATPTSSPARSTASRRSTTSRSTTRSTTTGS